MGWCRSVKWYSCVVHSQLSWRPNTPAFSHHRSMAPEVLLTRRFGPNERCWQAHGVCPPTLEPTNSATANRAAALHHTCKPQHVLGTCNSHLQYPAHAGPPPPQSAIAGYLEDLSEAINGALQILAAGDSVSVSVRELCRAPVRAALSRPFGGILNNAVKLRQQRLRGLARPRLSRSAGAGQRQQDEPKPAPHVAEGETRRRQQDGARRQHVRGRMPVAVGWGPWHKSPAIHSPLPTYQPLTQPHASACTHTHTHDCKTNGHNTHTNTHTHTHTS